MTINGNWHETRRDHEALYWAVLCHPVMPDSLRLHGLHSLPDSSVHADSLGKNIGVGYHALLRGIFPTHGSNPGLLHCRQTLYCPSHQGGHYLNLSVFQKAQPNAFPRTHSVQVNGMNTHMHFKKSYHSGFQCFVYKMLILVK